MYRGSSGGCGAGQKHDREGGADRGKHDNNPGRILGENGRKRQGVNPNRITKMQAHNGVGGWTDVRSYTPDLSSYSSNVLLVKISHYLPVSPVTQLHYTPVPTIQVVCVLQSPPLTSHSPSLLPGILG
ncbi:hypothetical protein DPX16_5531 [Anabarilius grahami]|uniref:Uncharacterized protein n=1 Tax=Anabarilius grahami TaxID=495550 RepID=A0A3N0Z3A6_ANAGA|nr:hypothetical protein DPX16_5531 [Anabarilius grahami]